MAVVVMTTRNETLNALTYWPSTLKEGKMSDLFDDCPDDAYLDYPMMYDGRITKKEGKMDDANYLLSECERLEAKVKELEDNIPDPEWCCEKHKAGLVARIKELEEGIEEIINYSSNYSANLYLADMRDKLKKLMEKEKP